MTRIAILASGRGSNFSAIAQAVASGHLAAEICCLLSDQPTAPVLAKAEAMGIATRIVPYPERQDGMSSTHLRHHHGELILAALAEFAPRFLVLAGFMRVLSPIVIQAFSDAQGFSRIVNIHPALLPSFPGIHSYRQAFEYGVKVTGATVHLVSEDVDLGPICAQESFSIAGCRSASEVEKLGLSVEHPLFVNTLSWLLEEKFTVERRGQGRLCVCQN